MLKQQTIIDQIEITHSGPIQIRFAKQIVDSNTGEVVASEWHRTAVDPGGDHAATMAAVNTHLAAMGREPVATDDELLKVLDKVVALAHTPERVAALRDARAIK